MSRPGISCVQKDDSSTGDFSFMVKNEACKELHACGWFPLLIKHSGTNATTVMSFQYFFHPLNQQRILRMPKADGNFRNFIPYDGKQKQTITARTDAGTKKMLTVSCPSA